MDTRRYPGKWVTSWCNNLCHRHIGPANPGSILASNIVFVKFARSFCNHMVYWPLSTHGCSGYVNVRLNGHWLVTGELEGRWNRQVCQSGRTQGRKNNSEVKRFKEGILRMNYSLLNLHAKHGSVAFRRGSGTAETIPPSQLPQQASS